MTEALLIDVVSDIVCPWCYVGKKRLEQACTMAPEIPVLIHWRPFQLDPTIPQEGVPRRAYMEKKFGSLDKIAPVHERLTALGAELGIPFNFPAITISPNTLDAHRLIRWSYGSDQNAMAEALFRAFFVDAQNLADRAVLARIAASCGFSYDEILARLETDEDVTAVQGEIAGAQQLGIQGVPFFIFDQRYAVSGAEAPEHLAAALRQAYAERAPAT